MTAEQFKSNVRQNVVAVLKQSMPFEDYATIIRNAQWLGIEQDNKVAESADAPKDRE